MNDIDQKIRQIKDLNKKRDDLMDELVGSIALRRIWPEVFDHGSVKVRVDGFLIDPSKAKLIITNGVGEKREILLKDAPRAIRDQHVKAFAPEDAYGFRGFFRRLNQREDKITEMAKTIEWTRPRLDRLKEEVKTAKEHGDKSFWLKIDGENHQFLVRFAEYLIEYLEGLFKAQEAERRNLP